METTPPERRTGDEQFRLLVDAVKDYAIFLLDPEGRVATWNAGAERIKGYTAEEILGRSFAEFYPADDRAAGMPETNLRRARTEGRYEGYGWRVRADGTRFYAHVTLTALRDAGGRLLGFAKVTQDVTQQRLRQEELAASAVRFRTTVEHLLDPLAILSAVRDADGQVVDFRYEYVNPAHLEQAPVSGASVLGRTVRELHDEIESSGLLAAYRNVVDTGEPMVWDAFSYKGTVSGKAVQRVLDVRAAKLDDGLLVTWRNVTDRLRTEQQLADARLQAELHRRLQASLLPAVSLHCTGVELATRYQPGGERALLGADFYDALQLTDGTIAILVGDVAGHGPEEAGVGVALRVAWRTMVLTGYGSGELLSGLDRVLESERASDELFATVACAWIQPDRRAATIALAGHPAPLLAGPDGVGVVQVPNGPALGIDMSAEAWPSGTVPLEEPWLLLFYTDGLIEGRRAPGDPERFGMERLAEAVARLGGGRLPRAELLDRLLEITQTANGGQLSDDVAIVCLSAGWDLQE